MTEVPKIDPVPWLVPDIIPTIAGLLTKNSKVLEFGSGGSTLWFAGLAGEVVSVEHDAGWHARVRAEIPAHVYLTREEPPYRIFTRSLPDNYFDLVLVDGRRRCDCMIASFRTLKKGGYLVLDNSEREDYKPGIDFLLSKGMVSCAGSTSHEPYPYPGWSTEIFKKVK